MNGRIAIATAPASAIGAEAAALRESVLQVCPRVGRELAPLALEPEAPERVRAFWETFGWTDTLDERCWLARPEVTPGREWARKLRSEIKRSGVRVPHEQLPTNDRPVAVDSGGLGFMITDEDGDSADPRIMVVSASTMDPSEVAWLGEKLDHERTTSPPVVFPSTPRGPIRDEDPTALDERVSVFAPRHRATTKGAGARCPGGHAPAVGGAGRQRCHRRAPGGQPVGNPG